MKIKTAMVVDAPDSALATVAKERSRAMKSDVIFATDFCSPKALVDFLIDQQYKQILFSWRGIIKEGSKTLFFRDSYLRLISQAKVHALVPDYLGLNPRFNLEEELLLKSVHGYWVTCMNLLSQYQKHFPASPPAGVLHDLPDVETIRALRNLSWVPKGIIWVGNSQWGSRYGYRDLKGYCEIVVPLVKELQHGHPGLQFRVFDSAKGKTPNKIILREMAATQVLIQASYEEGTGLPLLEALGLGILPVTTNVGIASEVLSGKLSEFIVDRNTSAFRDGVNSALAKSDEYYSSCIEIFEKYIQSAENEEINWIKPELFYTWPKPNIAESVKIWFIWLLRSFRTRRIGIYSDFDNNQNRNRH